MASKWEYLAINHAKEIQEILDSEDPSKYYSIYINFLDLFDADAQEANNVLKKPKEFLPKWDKAAIKAQEQVAGTEQLVKKNVRIRICSIPESEVVSEFGELITAPGVVVRMSEPKVTKVKNRLKCKKCQYINEIKIQWELNKIPVVKQCKACKVKKVEILDTVEQDEYVDYQEIIVQERTTTDCSSNVTKNGMQIILIEDLVDKCITGDYVYVCGSLIRRWEPLVAGQRAYSTPILLANSVTVSGKMAESTYSKEQISKLFSNYWKLHANKPLVGRDQILASICPQLYGMYTIKLALAVVLAGGVPKTGPTGERVRGDLHMLLCGDPGTGKSQILKTACRLCLRSVHTTGVGSTSAGLTAAAVKDSDGFHLEAGALVLANGGVCCIDEFTTMSNTDLASMHEAMEQQTVSIAKGGLLSTLNTRCTVIAAINPVGGRFVEGEETKTRLGNPLLSRFDLILYFKDNYDPAWDKLTVRHILDAATTPHTGSSQMDSRNYTNMSAFDTLAKDDSETNISICAQGRSNSNVSNFSVNTNSETLNTEGVWTEGTLREYFSHIRTIKPTFTAEAENIIKAAYVYHRNRPERKEDRTTVRLMDSLVRLAEGHARLMYRTEVTVMDAIIANQLILANCNSGVNQSQFPDDPTAVYLEDGANEFKNLGLDNLNL